MQPPGPSHGARLHAGRTPAADPARVLPPRDNPLGPLERLGWACMSNRVWDRAAIHSPFFYYFLGRTRVAAVAAWSPFIVWGSLLGIEALAVTALFTGMGMDVWFALLFLEILILPLLIGLFGVLAAGTQFVRLFGRVSWAELMSAPIDARDVVAGLACRALCRNNAGMLLNTAGLALMYHETTSHAAAATPGAAGLLLILVLALLLFRAYLFRTFADYGAACALRAGFMTADRAGIIARALRDYLLWWPLLAMATPALILAVIGLLALATTPLLALPLSLLLPVGMGLMAAFTEERARRLIRWTLDCRDVWAFNRDDRSLAPMHAREWRG